MAIPNGCSLPVWMGDEERRSHLRKQLGLKENVRYFLFIGRFSREKNPDGIVQAFEAMNDPCIGVILLGEGVMFEELKRHETDRILLPGFKPNVHDYVLASDYYISASDTEGLANTLLESMSVGLPCVLSDIPSHHEVVDKAEQPMAFLYDQHNLNAMTKAIRDILQLDKAQTGTYIRSLYARYYTAEKMSQSYQEAYIRLMASVNTKSKKEEIDFIEYIAKGCSQVVPRLYDRVPPIIKYNLGNEELIRIVLDYYRTLDSEMYEQAKNYS